jgi:hypothetical protein
MWNEEWRITQPHLTRLFGSLSCFASKVDVSLFDPKADKRSEGECHVKVNQRR